MMPATIGVLLTVLVICVAIFTWILATQPQVRRNLLAGGAIGSVIAVMGFLLA